MTFKWDIENSIIANPNHTIGIKAYKYKCIIAGTHGGGEGTGRQMVMFWRRIYLNSPQKYPSRQQLSPFICAL